VLQNFGTKEDSSLTQTRSNLKFAVKVAEQQIRLLVMFVGRQKKKTRGA